MSKESYFAYFYKKIREKSPDANPNNPPPRTSVVQCSPSATLLIPTIQIRAMAPNVKIVFTRILNRFACHTV